MGIISKAVLFPGAIPLLMNLITSYDGNKATVDQEKAQRKEYRMTDIDLEDNTMDEMDNDWLTEYESGCKCKIKLRFRTLWHKYILILSDSYFIFQGKSITLA